MPSYNSTRESGRPRPWGLSGFGMVSAQTLIALAAGTILGLVLGLIIGWAVWPVQWTNAWPADLSPEAQAQYLAAVAEAYVYYGDEEAAQDARNRLYDLEDELPEAIAAAQAFFAENPQRNSRVYINNLGQLAQDLGIQSPDIIVDNPPAAVAPAEEAAAPEASEVGTSVRTWVNWFLMLLAAIVLIGGGLYVIARLAQRRGSTNGVQYVEDEPEGFEEEDNFAPQADTSLFRRPPSAPAPAPAATARPSLPAQESSPQPYASSRQTDRYGFDDEHFDDEPADAPLTYGRGILVSDDSAGQDATFGDEGDAIEDEDLVQPDEPYAEEMDETADDGEPSLAPATYAAGPGAGTAAPAAKGEVLKTFTAHYQAGIPDYDQSYSIMDPVTGRYIGECGMGVNLKNGILQNNPDNVIALDVWLVDKKQEKSYSSQSRVLFSEHVIDHKLEQAFTRERPNDAPPLVPQPGMSFQLKGPNLILDCQVVEALYAKSGPAAGIFQSVKVDMTVISRA